MDFSAIVGCFFGGAFATNAFPHYIAGLQGKPMQSPFAKPPGKGLSSSFTNVCWGWINFAFAYCIFKFVEFNISNAIHFYSAMAGSFAIACLCAHQFGPINGGDIKDTKST